MLDTLRQFWRLYTHPKMLVVLGMGFSSGLPYLVIGSTLAVWLTEAGIDKAEVGVFALAALPYSFNFLLAPFMDQLRLPILYTRLGRRRSWILLTQIALALTIAMLGQLSPEAQTFWVAGLAVAIALCSAAQDVVVDAFRAEYLDEPQYGAGAAVAVFGYRLGMLMAGAGALALAETIHWPLVFMVLAAGMTIGLITTLCASEPPDPYRHEADNVSGNKRLRRGVIEPFIQFSQAHRAWLWIVLFILCYRLPDGFIGFLTNAYYRDIGFSKIEIATIAKLYGFGATLAGMFIGGALVNRLGIMRCLLLFLLLQMMTNCSFVLLGHGDKPSQQLLALVITADNLAGGMLPAVAIAYMMTLCDARYTATQYALLSSMASLASKTLAGFAGFVAEQYGWHSMFIASALLGLPALLLWRTINRLETTPRPVHPD